MVATLRERTANEAIAGSEGVCGLKSGSWFCVCVCAFGRNMTSTGEKMFTHIIYFIKTFYKFSTFNVIFNDNSLINCITVQHKKGSLLSTLMGHTPGY
jgi:hypothetical protein